jgi:hypothetical protein
MQEMRVIIDRFEGDFAVCEKADRSMMNIRRDQLPASAREGDVLIIREDRIQIDAAETARRGEKAADFLRDLWK